MTHVCMITKEKTKKTKQNKTLCHVNTALIVDPLTNEVLSCSSNHPTNLLKHATMLALAQIACKQKRVSDKTDQCIGEEGVRDKTDRGEDTP